MLPCYLRMIILASEQWARVWVTASKRGGEFCDLTDHHAPSLSFPFLHLVSLDCAFHHFSNPRDTSLNSIVFRFQCTHLTKPFSRYNHEHVSTNGTSQTIGKIVHLRNGGLGAVAIKWLPPHFFANKYISLSVSAGIPSAFNYAAKFWFFHPKASLPNCGLVSIPIFPLSGGLRIVPGFSCVFNLVAVIFHIHF